MVPGDGKGPEPCAEVTKWPDRICERRNRAVDEVAAQGDDVWIERVGAVHDVAHVRWRRSRSDMQVRDDRDGQAIKGARPCIRTDVDPANRDGGRAVSQRREDGGHADKDGHDRASAGEVERVVRRCNSGHADCQEDHFTEEEQDIDDEN